MLAPCPPGLVIVTIHHPRIRDPGPKGPWSGTQRAPTQSFGSAVGSQRFSWDQDPVLCGLLVIDQPLRRAGTRGSGRKAVFCEEPLKCPRLRELSPCGVLLRWTPRPTCLLLPAGTVLSPRPANASCHLYWFSRLCHPSAAPFPSAPTSAWPGPVSPTAVLLGWLKLLRVLGPGRLLSSRMSQGHW